MLHSTEGIVLNTFRYSDSSIIAKIYTRLFGLQSYIVSGGRSKKSRTKATLLQPLSNIVVIVNHKEKNNLHHMQELQCPHPYQTIPYNLVKSSIMLFLNEILYKCIREEEPNTGLFDFINSSLQVLDVKEEDYNNFHLLFMIKLSMHLGFYPQGKYNDTTSWFDMQEGSFVEYKPSHPFFLHPKDGENLYKLMNCSYEDLRNDIVLPSERKSLLTSIVSYFELHLSSVKDIKSHHVLSEVMA